MKYLKYLKYVIIHRWFVMIECFKFGLYWRGLVHDWSKFLPGEFIPYANFFYGENKKSVRDETGYYKPYDTGDDSFDYAWLLHQKRNKHHWQYWVLPLDDGDDQEVKILRMPYDYWREMVCDWKGAGKAQGTPDTLKWYTKNKDKIRLHKLTRVDVETAIGYEV